MTDFSFSLTISLPTGGWLNLHDGTNYRVGAESFAEVSTGYRRTEVTSPYTAGSYLVHAVPENVMEAIEIYCYGATYGQAKSNAQAAIAAFAQPQYTVRKTIAGQQLDYTCFTADYSVRGGNVFVANKMIPVVFQVPRLPATGGL